MWLSETINKQVIKREVGNVAVDSYYDVIVVGLGAAGAIACISAAKKKLRVLGLERMNCMGGTATAASVLGYYFGNRGGIYEGIDERSLQYNGDVYTFSGGSFGAESKKYVLEDESVKNGATICYEAVCIGIYLEDKHVKGIRYITPDGIKNAFCNYLIDGTGNGDICNMAGCETLAGRELDGRMQPFTAARGFFTENRIKHTNDDCGMVNPMDANAMTHAIISSRAAHFKKRGMDERQQMLYLAPLLGVREGRRIVGEKMPRLKDFFEGKVTKEPVFYAYSDIDKHGADNAFESETMQDWWIAANLGAVNVSVPVDFSSLIPKDYEGIMAVGRCISHDRDLSSCVRMMRDMQKSGEVAATAAALAISRNCSIRELPYDILRSELIKTGCLDEANNIGINFDAFYPVRNTVRIHWLEKEEDIKKELDSERPGVAIWSCYLIGKAMIGPLKRWLKEGGENLRKHSAIALGLLKDSACLPVIREMICERDPLILKDCRKNNQIRGVVTIYIAGKLRDPEITEELIDLVINSEEFSRPVYHSDKNEEELYLQSGYHHTYYQFLTHAIRALIRIRDQYPALRGTIAVALRTVIGKRVPGAPNGSVTELNNTYGYQVYLLKEAITLVAQNALSYWEN